MTENSVFKWIFFTVFIYIVTHWFPHFFPFRSEPFRTTQRFIFPLNWIGQFPRFPWSHDPQNLPSISRTQGAKPLFIANNSKWLQHKKVTPLLITLSLSHSFFLSFLISIYLSRFRLVFFFSFCFFAFNPFFHLSGKYIVN